MTYFQVESELAGLGQEDRDLFLEDMGVTDEECGLHVSTETDCIRGYLFYSIIEEKRREEMKREGSIFLLPISIVRYKKTRKVFLSIDANISCLSIFNSQFFSNK